MPSDLQMLLPTERVAALERFLKPLIRQLEALYATDLARQQEISETSALLATVRAELATEQASLDRIRAEVAEAETALATAQAALGDATAQRADLVAREQAFAEDKRAFFARFDTLTPKVA